MQGFLKTIAFVAAISISFVARATSASPDERFTQANNAYDNGEYQQAAEIYNQIIDDGFASWQLYYNLGNAYYRMDQMGNAILNYKRALRLSPNKRVVKDNLTLAQSKTVDNIEEIPKMFLVQWTDKVSAIMSPRGWRTATIIILTLTAALAAVFFIARNYSLRKTAFILLAIFIIFTLFSAFNAAISAKKVTNNKEAVIIAPMVVVKGSPDAKSVDKFIIHEGTLLSIDDEQDDWWQITIADGKSGWINSGAERV